MATGTGAVYFKNLPPPNTFQINAPLFAKETSRNQVQNAPQVIPGFGQKVAFTVDATGVVGRIILTVQFTLTNQGAVPTVTSQWPWNFLSQFQLNANGINGLFSCDGIELRALARVRNGYFIDRESTFAISDEDDGVSQITLIYEVPVAFDDKTLMGAIFAQTEDTNLTWTFIPAQASDLFSANPPLLSAATVTPMTEMYSIPYADTQNQGRIAIIPDLRRMHGFYSQTAPLAATTYSPLNRVNGILCRVLQRGNNAANAAGDVGWSEYCQYTTFQYGSNQQPYSIAGQTRMYLNEQDNGDYVLQQADSPEGVGPVNYAVLDLVKDNAMRDVIHLLGVTQPQMISQFTGLTVENGNNSVIQTAQEQMIAGA